MASYDMCHTGHAPPPPPPRPQHRLMQNSILMITQNEPSDHKGPENIIYTMVTCYGRHMAQQQLQ